jgi:hypothetical protein
MPLAKIHVLEGRHHEARLGRVSSAVQNGLIRALRTGSEFIADGGTASQYERAETAVVRAPNDRVVSQVKEQR